MYWDFIVRLLKIHTENIIILSQFWIFKVNTTKKSRFNNMCLNLFSSNTQRLIVDIFFWHKNIFFYISKLLIQTKKYDVNFLYSLISTQIWRKIKLRIYLLKLTVYRVIGLVLRHFRLLVWPEFRILHHLIKLVVVLSSGNLCLINHLILLTFWSLKSLERKKGSEQKFKQ